MSELMTEPGGPPAFPFSSPVPYEPAPEYAALLDKGPLAKVTLPTGHEAWVAISYDAVRAVATDQRFSKQAVTAPDAPRLLPITRGSQSMVMMDPPQHTRLRKLVSRDFTPRRIELLRPRITQVTAELIDALQVGGTSHGTGDGAAGNAVGDAVAALAMPLPIIVICELLGVPLEEQEQFRGRSDAFMSVTGPRGGDPEEGPRAAAALHGYLAELVARKRKEPGDDLLTALLRARDEEDSLSEGELIAFGMTLLVAGYHTTASSIAHSLFHLLSQPERYAELVADPGIIPGAADELLRYSHVGSGFGSLRIAVEDVEVCGVRIAKGEPVIPSFAVANRDPAAFERAEVLDLHRPSAAHLSFGAGIHYCLGAQLARVELAELLDALVRRLPGLRLDAPADSLQWLTRVAFTRPVTLPIAW